MSEGFRQFLLKIHSRCNLACDYCYVYEAADQSWRGKPRTMAPETVLRTAARIAEHARETSASRVSVVLHGGEPLLVGADSLDSTLRALTRAVDEAPHGGCEVAFTVQTNGLLLRDPGIMRVLREHRVGIGVSLDGTARSHDRHRRYANGRGSHAATARALRHLDTPADRHLFAGLLCTVDLAADPVETYEALLAFSPPRLDLLLPHGTWQTPPPGLAHRTVPPQAPPAGADAGRGDGRADGTRRTEAVPYADWLCAVFDRWYAAPRRETGIRLFEELMALLLGGRANSELVGLAPLDLAVVETDGTIELSDSLKVSYPGAPETGLDVFRHSFAEAARHESFRALRRGRSGLGPVCDSCALATTCGGGLHAHRYHPGSAEPFAHPTVYCADLAVLIGHIRARLDSDLAALTSPGTAPGTATSAASRTA